MYKLWKCKPDDASHERDPEKTVNSYCWALCSSSALASVYLIRLVSKGGLRRAKSWRIQHSMDVLTALELRQSIRGFQSQPVPEEVLREVFGAAQRAPSWCNIQPWRVWLASGERRIRLGRALVDAAGRDLPSPEVDFPVTYPEPYQSHRRQCASVLYGAMGVAREDREARQAAWMRNFASFDAPHVAIVGVDTSLGFYVGVDIGCWLQSVLLAASARGLAACPQASVSIYPSAIREVLPISEDVSILFGIAIGYASEGAAVNQARTSRGDVDANITFVT